MRAPDHLQYAKTHEWVEFLPDGTARIGLTDHAQEALGDIVFVNLPPEGETLTAGEALGDVESVKAVSDILAPVGGTVSAVNRATENSPGLINESPYETWLLTVRDLTGRADLLDAAAYTAFCEAE